MRLSLWAALVCSGCAAKSMVDLADAYSLDGAEARAVVPTTVFVPGMLGSQLVGPDGRLYWGTILKGSPQPNRDPDDLRALALPVQQAPLSTLDDELEPGTMLLTVQVGPGPAATKVRAYPGVFEGLLAHIADDEATQAVRAVPVDEAAAGELPIVGHAYDWRHDIASEAARLHEVVLAAAAARKAMGGEARVDLIGHSMGALLIRYYLRYGPQPLPDDGSMPVLTWEGARHVSHALFVAPPNGGSALILASLLGGEKVNAVTPKYPAALVGTFPSIYQMLPRPRAGVVTRDSDGAAVDLYDVAVWDRYGWGLLDPDEAERVAWLLPDVPDADARRLIVRGYIERCLARAKQFHEALDGTSEAPEHLRMHLFVGSARPTYSHIEITDADGSRAYTAVEPGDGQVTRRSAMQDERDPADPARRLVSPLRWDTVHLTSGEHIDILADLQFLDNALYLLLQAP